MCPVARCRRGLRRDPSGSALPTLPQSVSRGTRFRGFTGSRLLRPVRLLAPLDGSDQVSLATGGFYIQASGGAVALSLAGYDYNSLWTPLLAGLSPAGMAASLAAPDLTGFPRPPGAFTSRLPAGWSPFPSLDMTTTDGVMGLAWMSCAVRWSSPDRMEVRGHGVHQPQASRTENDHGALCRFGRVLERNVGLHRGWRGQDHPRDEGGLRA